jgi:hypothetical protein
MPDSKNRIMIYGPKRDGTYVVEGKTAAGEALELRAGRLGSPLHNRSAPATVV